MVQMRILTSNVGVGVSLSGEVADGSLEVGLSIPMGRLQVAKQPLIFPL